MVEIDAIGTAVPYRSGVFRIPINQSKAMKNFLKIFAMAIDFLTDYSFHLETKTTLG